MPLTKDKKTEIMQAYGRAENDTGSPEVQVALLTERIIQLTGHLKQFSKDNHSRRGLMKLVGQRRRQLNYLNKTNPEAYRKLIERLGLRR